jgi:hypothetical protein
MTREEQKQFIINCLDQTKEALLAKVGRVPEDWDGHELRAWIEYDVLDQISSISLIRQEPRSKRAKDFHKALLQL